LRNAFLCRGLKPKTCRSRDVSVITIASTHADQENQRCTGKEKKKKTTSGRVKLPTSMLPPTLASSGGNGLSFSLLPASRRLPLRPSVWKKKNERKTQFHVGPKANGKDGYGMAEATCTLLTLVSVSKYINTPEGKRFTRQLFRGAFRSNHTNTAVRGCSSKYPRSWDILRLSMLSEP
jgi:hypothetical protein